MPMIQPPKSFHLAAFYALDTAATADEDIASVVNDNFLTRQNNHYWGQEDYKLLAAYVRDAGVTRARLSTPDFRRVSIPAIYPVNRQAAPITLVPYAWYGDQQIIVPKLDEVSLLVTNDGGGGVACYGGIWLEHPQHNLNLPPGDVYTLRATTSNTTVVGQWTQSTLTFDQVLPAGTFSIIGMYVTGATAEFARLSFLGGGMRPGVICMPTVVTQPWRDFIKGGRGVLGSFTNTAPPNIEILGSAAATTTYNVYMDTVLTGPG